MRDWIYKHRRLVCGIVAGVILLIILASCQGLINVNGSDESPVVIQSVRSK